MNEETLISIIGAFCDHMIDNCKCNLFCHYAETKDNNDEREVWRTIASIRKGRELE